MDTNEGRVKAADKLDFSLFIAAGYKPVACQGKAPVGEGWQNEAPLDVLERRRAAGATNLGLQCDNLSPVDIDHVLPEHVSPVSGIFTAILGPSQLERVGLKGSITLYANAIGMKTIRIRDVGPDGKGRTLVEVLGWHKQFIAYGEHPGDPKHGIAPRAYRWTNSDAHPALVPWHELPKVTPDTVRNAVTAAAAWLTATGKYIGVHVDGDKGEAPHETPEPSAASGTPVTPEQLRAMMGFIDPNKLSEEEWLGLALMLRHGQVPLEPAQTGDWFLQLLDDWTSGRLWAERTGDQTFTNPYYRDLDSTLSRLGNSPRTEGNRTTIGSVIHKARAAGYIRGTAAHHLDGLPEDDDDERLIPDAEGRIFLSYGSPSRSARMFLAQCYDHDWAGFARPTLYHYRGGFYHWTGTHYAEVIADTLTAQVHAFLEAAYVRVDGKGGQVEVARYQPNPTRKQHVLDALRSICHLDPGRTAPFWMSPALELWPFHNPEQMIVAGNGLVSDAVIRALLPHTPDFFSLNALGINDEDARARVDYVPVTAKNPEAAEHPEWTKFLNSLWPGDQEAVNTLHEMFGYLLTADTRQQKVFLIKGPIRCGKGTIARILRALLGHASTAFVSLPKLGQNFGMQSLIGKSVCIVPEGRAEEAVNRAGVVQVLVSVSGEDPQSIPRKYLGDWEGKLPVRFLLLCNHFPAFLDNSGALVGRLVPLEIVPSFYGKEDLGLEARLMQELPAILNSALDGAVRLRLRGHFQVPKSSKEFLDSLTRLVNPIGAFGSDRLVVDAEGWTSTDDLFEQWLSWCVSGNRKDAGTKEMFSRNLKSSYPQLARRQRRVKGKPAWGYEGVRLAQRSCHRCVTGMSPVEST